MGRFPQKEGRRGSLKWVQHFVNDHARVLDAALRPILPLATGETLTWLSPLREDAYAEYRDQSFLDRLGIGLSRRPLSSFWPARGPQWDALARSSSDKVVLVEAKAHIAELLSPPTQAREPSLSRIRSALGEAAAFFGAVPGTDWSQRFYQYTNRLAHIYLLRELNELDGRGGRVDAHLVFMYFVGDSEMQGPMSQAEWEAAILVLQEALGLRGRLPSDCIHDVLVEVREPR